MGTYYRNPRTQQERRINSGNEYRLFEILIGGKFHQVHVRIRGKRRLRQMVHAFLDLPRQRQRNWKEHRRTQYKMREIPPPSDSVAAITESAVPPSC